MVQESTVICVDNSEYMRNGDLSPNRLQCEQEAVRALIQSKLRSNPENAVSLLTMAPDINVLASLTSEDRKLTGRIHQIEIEGSVDVVRAIKTAHLVLKNRANRNHKMRIVVFIGSPLDDLVENVGDAEFMKLAKKLKKENVKVDFVLFGEATSIKNSIILDFVGTLNGTDGVGSNVVVMTGDTKLYEALLSSAICRGEDGVGGAAGEFDYGIDADEDPELALALRVSMEEQRQRQRQADATAAAANNPDAQSAAASGNNDTMDVDKAPAGSSSGGVGTPLKIDNIDPATMTEEQQLQWALRMSMVSDVEKEGEKSGATGTSVTASAEAGSSTATAATSAGGETSLLQPVSSGGDGRSITEGNKVDDEVLSSAGATASGTPAPTPMEADDDGSSESRNTIGQLMHNMDLLKHLVDQIPEPDQSDKKDGKEGKK